jgi:hypothetical protein
MNVHILPADLLYEERSRAPAMVVQAITIRLLQVCPNQSIQNPGMSPFAVIT